MSRRRPTPVTDLLKKGSIVSHPSGAVGVVVRVSALTATVRWPRTDITSSVRRLTLTHLPDDTVLPELRDDMRPIAERA